MKIIVQDNAIQAAIDKVNASGGGCVELTPGTHDCATIYMKSNVELHFQDGAVLSGSTNPDAYDDFTPEGLLASPEDSKKCLLACGNCENIAITGNGVINANGLAFFEQVVPPKAMHFRKPAWPRPRILQVYRCKNVRVEGVTLLDSPGWTVWLTNSQDILMQNLKIHGDHRIINNDGIDIDSCQNVTIQNIDFSNGDDCIAVRAIRMDMTKPAICSNLIVRNCVMDSACSAIRIGCPSDDTIKDCHFSNIKFKGHGHGIRCEAPYQYLRKNCKGYMYTDNITFEDIEIESDRIPIKMTVSPSIKLRRFGGFLFRNIKFKSGQPISLLGTATTNVEDVTLENIQGTVLDKTPMIATFVTGLHIKNLDVTAITGEPDDGIIPGERGPSWETKF